MSAATDHRLVDDYHWLPLTAALRTELAPGCNHCVDIPLARWNGEGSG
jgi:hypothetical protein